MLLHFQTISNYLKKSYTMPNAGTINIWNNHVLLVREKNKGFWVLPGGTGERDEKPLKTAIRETEEEAEIDLRGLRYTEMIKRRTKRGDYVYTFVFHISENPLNTLEGTLNTTETDAYKWVPVDVVLEAITGDWSLNLNGYLPKSRLNIPEALSLQLWAKNELRRRQQHQQPVVQQPCQQTEEKYVAPCSSEFKHDPNEVVIVEHTVYYIGSSKQVDYKTITRAQWEKSKQEKGYNEFAKVKMYQYGNGTEVTELPSYISSQVSQEKLWDCDMICFALVDYPRCIVSQNDVGFHSLPTAKNLELMDYIWKQDLGTGKAGFFDETNTNRPVSFYTKKSRELGKIGYIILRGHHSFCSDDCKQIEIDNLKKNCNGNDDTVRRWLNL